MIENGKTIVQLDAQVELDGVAALMPQLARIAVKHGVDNNLATLKRILEERVRAVSTTNEPSARSPATGGTPEAANLTPSRIHQRKEA